MPGAQVKAQREATFGPPLVAGRVGRVLSVVLYRQPEKAYDGRMGHIAGTERPTEDDATPTSPWTHFWDMHSGGGQKLDWEHIFVEADEDTARKLFAEAFGRDPDNESCSCCGGDYSISEYPSLPRATGYQRHLRFCSPIGDGEAWRNATTEERQESNRVAHYLEPDEEVPEGWHLSSVLPHGEPMTFDEFLADPHFVDFGRRREVKLLARPVHSEHGGTR